LDNDQPSHAPAVGGAVMGSFSRAFFLQFNWRKDATASHARRWPSIRSCRSGLWQWPFFTDHSLCGVTSTPISLVSARFFIRTKQRIADFLLRLMR
jgi:hypothetical protein